MHLDGHTDFRHPGNNPNCHSLAGEDLAAAIGLHWAAIADIDGHSPYFKPTDVAHMGCRDDDEHLDEVRRLIGAVMSVSQLRHGTTARAEHLMQQLLRSSTPGTESGCTSTSTFSIPNACPPSTAPPQADSTPTN